MTEDHKCVVCYINKIMFVFSKKTTVIEIVETFMSSDKIIISNNFLKSLYVEHNIMIEYPLEFHLQ